MAWTAVFTDNFTRADSSSLGNGWVDLGSKGRIVSNQANLLNSPVGDPPWTNDLILRPSSENLLNQRTSVTVGPSIAATGGIYLVFRTTSPGTEYIVGFSPNTGGRIIKVVAGSVSGVTSSLAFSPAYNSTHTYVLDAQVVGTNPTAISYTITDQTTGTVVCTATTNDSTASLQSIGQSGLYTVDSTAILTNFTTYTDAVIALTAGSATLNSVASGSASVTVGAAIGGTSPYTYQWYRSTINGFTPGSGNILSGATSLTLNDTGLTNGTTYYYKNIATDAVNATSTSNQISAVPTAAITPGTATTTATGSGTASVSVTAATGGTGTGFTYQWYRSTTSGFTPGSGNLVTGATSLTLNDTGLTNGTTYYYKNVVTDSGGNTATSNQTSAVPAVANIIAVNSTAVIFSPGNWKGDTGRGGSVYRKSWNGGAYFRARWTSASSGATATILIPTTSTGVKACYFINGKLIARDIAATGNITVTGIPAGVTVDLFFILESLPGSARWNDGTNTLQINGIQLDSGSTQGVAPVMSKWAMIVGDSITEGVVANNGANSNIYGYSYMVGLALLSIGYDYCVFACTGSGWIKTGDTTADVPAYYLITGGTYSEPSSRWNKIDAGVSLLDTNGRISAYGSSGTEPAAIYINYGTNEAVTGMSLSDLQTSVDQGLAALVNAAPAAKIVVGIPFSMYDTVGYPSGVSYINAIKAGVATKSSNANITLGDNGSVLSQRLKSTGYSDGGVHPFLIGHSTIAPLVTQQVQSAIGGTSGKASSYTFVS